MAKKDNSNSIIGGSNNQAPGPDLTNNWGNEHSAFVQVLHRNGVPDEDIAARVPTTFPEVLPRRKSHVERGHAVCGRVAIWTSKWADDKAGDKDVSKYSWGPALLEELRKRN
ncbi:MAG: hypothetical protein M1830_004141 [Pleopsidium flavum]|nr:MAG: hypothetical protein M1830_004141 [Pleopsidium flavum]